MLGRLIKYISIVLSLLVHSFAFTQSFVLKNYSTKDGLPSSETYYTAQDNKGYLWVTTDRGMAKFDGYKFITYTTEEGLPDNTNFQFIKDAKSRLWFCGFSSKLGFINNDSIYSYKFNDLIKNEQSNNFIDQFIVDDGNIFISKFAGSAPDGIDNANSIIKINKQGVKDTSYNIFKKGYQRVYVNKKGESVLTGDLEAEYTEFFTLENKELIAKVRHVQNTSKLKTVKLNSSDFISTIGNKIAIVNNQKVEYIWNCKAEVIQLFIDNELNIWIGYREFGYECLLAKENYKKAINGLIGYTVSSISEDKEGGTWLTTLENGVYYLSPQKFIAYFDSHGLKNKKIRNIVNIRGNILATNEAGDVYLKEKEEASFTKISYLGKNLRSNIFTIFYDEQYGLYSFLPLEKKFLSSSGLGVKNILLKHGVKVSFGKKYLWVVNPNEITKTDKNGKELETINLQSLPRIWSVFGLNEDKILIGTLNGLYLYENNTITDFKKNIPLFRYRINDIKELNSNYIIAGTIGGGLLIIDKNNLNNVRQIKEADGLPSLMCATITVGSEDSVWVGTNKGLCLVNNILDSAKKSFTTVNINNGLVANEVIDLMLKDDEVWVSTIGGISVLKRNKLSSSIKEIPIYIKKVNTLDEEINIYENEKIKHNKSITISYTGINFQLAERLRYKYRLKNVDSKWSYTSNLSVVYNALPPGNYIFEVGVDAPVSIKTRKYATFSFTIMPPFWQTNWFVITTVSFLTLLIILIVRNRINFVREQERLKQNLKTFRDRALRGQMNPHFIYNSLNAIQNYILKHEVDASATFLSKFSRLMRLTFNNTAEELVTLEKEIEALKIYAELENLRFNNKFNIHINIDDSIDSTTVKVPPLIIQPFVENSIIHGISGKNEKGNIWIDINKKENKLEVIIKDDGEGLEHAKQITARKSKFNLEGQIKENKKHSGIKTTQARIQQLWGKDYNPNYFKIVSIYTNSNNISGVLAAFYLPYYD